MRRIIDIVRSKYERMSDSERKQLLSHYPDEMLMEDDSVFLFTMEMSELVFLEKVILLMSSTVYLTDIDNQYSGHPPSFILPL